MENRLTPTLTNEKVILRPLMATDQNALWPIAQEKELWVYGLADLSEPNELQKYLEKAIADREQGTTIVFTVIEAKTGKVAGCTRFAEISWKDERAQIGWTWIGKNFQGTGLNTAMKYEMLKYGFETLGFNRIELKGDERNLQSRKAMEKIGAKYEGTLREHMKIKDGFIRNTVFYSILKKEWPEVKNNLIKYF